jgi:hypothetical protein
MKQNALAEGKGRPTQTPPFDGQKSRKILNTWKEIAAHLGRAVRTVQRYERDNNLPEHRIRGADHGSVMAFTDEINTWLEHTAMEVKRYVRPTLLVLDRVQPGSISVRKLVLEVGYFNVLTAYSVEEVYATAEKFDVDGFVLDHIPGSETSEEVCEAVKERYPQKPIFVMAEGNEHNSFAPRCADLDILGNDPQELLIAAIKFFGAPRPGSREERASLS